MQPQTYKEPSTSSPEGNQLKRGKPFLFIGLGLVVIITLIATIILFVFKPQHSSPAAIDRPSVTIANKPYLYACSMFTHDDITNAFNVGNKDKFFVSTVDAFSTNNKPVDVLNLTKKDAYGSSCTYNFDVTDLTPEGRNKSKKIDIYAVQYQDNATAQKIYEEYKSQVTTKPLPSFKTGYAFDEQDEKTGKKFLSASILQDNLEIIITTSTDFGLDEEAQISKIDNLAKIAFERIDNGEAKKMPGFNDVVSLGGKPLQDICTNLDIANLGKTLATVEFRPTDIYGVQNTTQLTDNNYAFPSLESVCSYKFRTIEESRDQTNATLSYDDRFTHMLSVTKRIFGNEKEAADVLKDSKARLQTPDSEGESRGEYAEVDIADGGARVVSIAKEDTRYNYYILQGNNYYRIEVISNNTPNKSFTPKGIKITDKFIKEVFEQASRS